MFRLKRFAENPILKPNSQNLWEKEAAFDGCPVESNGKFHLVYRALSSPQAHRGAKIELSTIGYAISNDGIHFTDRRQLIKPEYDWEAFGCEDPRITKLGNKYFIFYTALSSYPFSPSGIKIGMAITRDFETVEEKHPVTFFNSKAMALFSEKINGKIAAILTVHTDLPPAKIVLAFFDKEEQIWSRQYWEELYNKLDTHVVALLRSSDDHLEVGAPPIKTEYGWLLIYSYIKNYFKPSRTLGIEAVLLDLDNPQKIIAKTNNPLLIPEAECELNGKVPSIVFPTGALIRNNQLFVYYGASDTTLCLASCSLKDLVSHMQAKPQIPIIEDKKNKAKLQRFSGNPIITPRPEFAWEAKATFNPAAILLDGKVHLLYRAMSEDNTSVLGYATSSDGLRIATRLNYPVYTPREGFEEKKVLGGNSGCEDPRITRMGDTLYMCYTAYDGVNLPRVALTSISIEDFLAQRWNWTPAKLISPPGISDKDACILPEKIKNQYVFLHRLGTCICINLVDSLEFGEGKWLAHEESLIEPRAYSWDNHKIGLAAPPIKTTAGWLLLYHGILKPGNVYKVGAVLLALNNPTKVLARTTNPLLEPEQEYEKNGYVPKVVFPCGAVVIKDRLFVYYGGADKVVGVATAKLNDILEGLKL